MSTLNFKGVIVPCKFRGRSVPQWIADEALRLSGRQRGMIKHDLEKAIQQAYPLGSNIAVFRLATKVIRAGQRAGRLTYRDGVWRDQGKHSHTHAGPFPASSDGVAHSGALRTLTD